MKKFNKMESNLIVDSLNYYVANLESEIKQIRKNSQKHVATIQNNQDEHKTSLSI